MSTIKKAYHANPFLASVALVALGLVVLIALAASVLYLPHLLSHPFEPASPEAANLTQFASLLLLIIGFIAVWADRRAKRQARAHRADYSQHFSQDFGGNDSAFRQARSLLRHRWVIGLTLQSYSQSGILRQNRQIVFAM